MLKLQTSLCVIAHSSAAAVFFGVLTMGLASHGEEAGSRHIEVSSQDIVTVRPDAAEGSKQGLPIFPGISEKTAGSKGISMLRVVIPPGAAAKAHIHKGYETAVYLVQGRVETRYGPGLSKSVINTAGDFIFIPAEVPHQPRNLSDSEPAIAIVARTDPNEQEGVVAYPPAQ